MAVVVNKAKFTINGTAASTLGFDATATQLITLQLENAQGVSSVRYEVHDATDPSAPLASKSAPQIVFTVGGLPSIVPALPSLAVTFSVPNDVAASHTWIVRATATDADGVSQVFERALTLLNGKPRKPVPGESTQYSNRGWADAWADLITWILSGISGLLVSGSPATGQVPMWLGAAASWISGAINVQSYLASPSASASANVTALTNAVAAAVATGAELYWPAGTYQTNATIPLLHTVRHRGPGAIQRGSDVFYVQPKYAQVNRLYVATTGSSANDGLSSSQPMVSLQNAFDTLRNYGPFLFGDWRITLAAGTYTTLNYLHDTPSFEWVQIYGPAVGHPNVPTAILNGASTERMGIQVRNPGTQLWIQDVKAQNLTVGSSNGIGIFVSKGACLNAVNFHAQNCDFGGVVGDGAKDVNIVSGIYTSNRDHVVMNDCSGYIGRGISALPNGPIFRGASEWSVFWSRGAQGHVDYATFETAAPRHVRIESAARVHILGSDFRLATIAAISTNTDGSYYDDVSLPNVYNDGTGDANAKRYEHFAFTGAQQNWTDVAISEMCIYAENPGSTLTSATKAQVGADLVLPSALGGGGGGLRPYYFVDKKTRIRIKVWGDTPNATASFGVDFFNAGPGVKVMAYTAFVGTAAAGGFEYELIISPLTQTTQRGYARAEGSSIAPRIESGAATADMGLAQTIRLMAQSASGTITVRRVEVWVAG